MKNILFTLALLVSFSSCEQTPDAVYNNILQGLEKGFRQSAITGFNERAISKMNLKDYNGAIADLTKVIDYETENNFSSSKEKLAKKLGITVEELENRIQKDKEAVTDDYALAYNNRGWSKHNLKDDNGAIADYTKAIELNPDYALAYFNRGYSKGELKDHDGAKSDYTKAIELNPNYAMAYNNRGYSKSILEDYNGAIADYNKAIELDPNNSLAYANRGISKYILGDLNGACDDAKKVANLGDTDAAKWVAENCN